MAFLVTNGAFPKLDTPFVQPSRSGEPAESGRIIAVPWYRLLITFWNRTGGQSGYVPGQNQPGMMSPFAGPTANVPSGYLLCDGALYLVIDYPALFAAIGYTWGGAGDSFQVPNGTGRTMLGANGTHALGSVGGATTHAITQAELPNVALPVTDPGHRHFIAKSTAVATGVLVANTSLVTDYLIVGDNAYQLHGTNVFAADVGLSSSATTGITVNTGGIGTPIPTISPYFTGNWIIKT